MRAMYQRKVDHWFLPELLFPCKDLRFVFLCIIFNVNAHCGQLQFAHASSIPYRGVNFYALHIHVGFDLTAVIMKSSFSGI